MCGTSGVENPESRQMTDSRRSSVPGVDRFVVAVDGTAASGKSTTAREAARRLDFTYIDTGAMYRAVTLKALRERIDLSDSRLLAELVKKTDIAIRGERIFLDGADVTEEIRLPEIDRSVSLVSSYAEVRERLVEIQRRLGSDGRVICEGRDIGTIVFPDADVKIFMEADLRERAKRRREELRQRGAELSQEEVEAALSKRDSFDSQREASPLKRAKDAILIDTTHLTIEEEVERAVEEIEKAMG